LRSARVASRELMIRTRLAQAFAPEFENEIAVLEGRQYNKS
jgi:hypothetical protein